MDQTFSTKFINTTAPMLDPSLPSTSAVPQPQPHQMQQPALPQNGDEQPVKRKRGRPKGSGKKQLDPDAQESSSPGIKRPVGRPRKDGLPAGSVQKTVKSRPHLSAPAGPSNRGNWQNLARTDPTELLSLLLTSLASPNPIARCGPSVEEMFKMHLNALTQVSKENKNLPTLYSIMKTFWLPYSPSYFCLFATDNVKLSSHRFLYWDPLPITWTGIKCPACQSTALLHNGRIRTGPIKIYDVESPFFIIGCEYACPNTTCRHTFASTDHSILRSIPPLLRSEFPARLLDRDADIGTGPDVWDWSGRGVSLALWKIVRGCLDAGLDQQNVVQHVLATLKIKDEEEDADYMDEDMPFNEAYQNAWKENTGMATEVPPPPAVDDAPTQTTGSSSMSQQNSVPSPPSPHAPRPQFVPSTYQNLPYPFFPVYGAPPPHLAGVAGPASISHPPIAALSNGNSIHTPVETLSSTSGFKRSYPGDAGDGAPTERKRGPRHCVKCGSADCKGKGGRQFCMNACQDCGNVKCRGRNGRKACDQGASPLPT